MKKPVKSRIVHGDCLEILKTLSENSIDSIVTDPPAGIAFMGKEWDKDKGGGGTYNEEAGAKYGSIKAPAKNHHPTVKSVKLMEYLITMITKAGGTVLDPFCGSGSTLVAAKQNNYKYIGIDQELEYIEIAKARVNAVS